MMKKKTKKLYKYKNELERNKSASCDRNRKKIILREKSFMFDKIDVPA